MRVAVAVVAAIAALTASGALSGERQLRVREYAVPSGTHPHDVAPARDGGVWYTAQHTGQLGWLNPKTGRSRLTALGSGSAPHGVIVGPDGAPWITDGGLNAIVRVDPRTRKVRRFPLPASSGYTNLNTATFDNRGVLWFTGQSGIYGRLDPKVGKVRVFRAPRGEGPYGITTTPSGDVYYASLAGSYLGRIDVRTGRATVLRPPTAGQGARRAWSDSRGRIWISEWNAGKVGMYDPRAKRWREWRVPGANPMIYAVYVDERDKVWLTDFGANALWRFDPVTTRFTRVALPSADAAVRQLLGRRGRGLGRRVRHRQARRRPDARSGERQVDEPVGDPDHIARMRRIVRRQAESGEHTARLIVALVVPHPVCTGLALARSEWSVRNGHRSLPRRRSTSPMKFSTTRSRRSRCRL